MINYIFAMAPAGGDQSPFGFFIPMILIIVIMYFMIMRPAQKRQKEHEKLLSSIDKGDKVVTSGGMHGTVHSVDDTTVIIMAADNVKLKFNKSAIASVVSSKTSAAVEQKS
jgi:preprotein translocase subunit YajC